MCRNIPILDFVQHPHTSVTIFWPEKPIRTFLNIFWKRNFMLYFYQLMPTSPNIIKVHKIYYQNLLYIQVWMNFKYEFYLLSKLYSLCFIIKVNVQHITPMNIFIFIKIIIVCVFNWNILGDFNKDEDVHRFYIIRCWTYNFIVRLRFPANKSIALNILCS